MGLTFWAELYFRSLKRNNVLAELTKYLLQYRRVCIPHIGTFEIIQQSPQLRVADQMMTAPVFRTTFRLTDAVPEHQFDFFAVSNSEQKDQVKNDLFLFGQQLKEQIQQGPFEWNGFGTLKFSGNELVFEPLVLVLDSLQKIPAEKVIRHNVAHQILVGDQETTTHEMSEVLHKSIVKRPLLLAGWIVVVVSIIIIVLILYVGKFQVYATGLKMKVGH